MALSEETQKEFQKEGDRIRKIMLLSGKEILRISEKGTKALSNPESRDMFKGMFKTIESHLNKFEDYYEKLMTVYDKYDQLADFPSSSDLSNRSKVLDYYYQAHADFEKLFTVPPEKSTSIGYPATNVTLQDSRSSRNLPKIILPKFDGSQITEWPKFRDTFTSLVIKDDSLSEIEKFHYLITSVSGNASSIINHLPLSETNFEVAWKALKDAYNNNRILANTYLNNILSFRPQQGKPTHESLRTFLTKISDNISALKLLKIENESDFILFHLAIRCLDPVTRQKFEIANKTVDFPNYEMLTKFIREHSIALQLAENSNNLDNQPSNARLNDKNKQKQTTKTFVKPALLASSESKSPCKSDMLHNCPICKGSSHAISKCTTFYSITPNQRLNLLRNWKGCKNCLSSSHNTHSCPSKWSCRLCNHRHNTMLHIEPTRNKSDSDQAVASSQSKTLTHDGASLSSTSCNEVNVLLGTAVVDILDAQGHAQPIRIVVDSASHYSFITQKCMNKLGLSMKYSPKKISGIGQTLFDGIKGQLFCTIKPRNKVTPQLHVDALVVKNITSFLPTVPVPNYIFSKYVNFELADPNFWEPSSIDFLLGGDLFSEIWNGSPITLNEDLPKLFESIFGYIVIGKYFNSSAPTGTSLFISTCEGDDLNANLTRFWELEEPSLSKLTPSADQSECEEHFRNTHYRTETGRYVVKLPFKHEPPLFPHISSIAMKRYRNLEAKLDKNFEFKEQYSDFMTEYINLQHMAPTNEPAKFVIPHHGIFKIDRGKNKLRVVFDASVKTVAGSLNDCFHVGPKLQNDIRAILLNFRIHPIVFVTDIVKMYRQIQIDPAHCAYQHIYWRRDSTKPIEQFKLKTLTYGLGCSPFLAIRVIHQLTSDEGKDFPKAAKVLIHSSYVDDIAAGAQSVAEALDIQQQLIGILERGGFKLSKWASNCSALLESVAQDNNSTESVISLQDSDDISLKILGLQWDPKTDQFSYSISIPSIVYTKRGILSAVARIYDPLGFLSPSVIVMKSLVQDLWKERVDWDQSIPNEIEEKWSNLVTQLEFFSQIKIPRYVCSEEITHYRVVGFSDASSKAYCAALYLQIICSTEISSRLLVAKTKLAPVKQISIPRLELCAALLLARLYEAISSFLENLPHDGLPSKFFSDSSIVLGWINTPSYKLKTFVGNRITEINNLTPSESWGHVHSELNPADCGSRGLPPENLVNFQLWWSGPPWLSFAEELWPSVSPEVPIELPEMTSNRITMVALQYHPDFIKWMSRFSSFLKLLRSIAWLKRCIKNKRIAKIGGPQQKGSYTFLELEEARWICIKIVQSHFFFNGDSAKPQSAMKKYSKLHPFIDSHGIFRVGGRLRHANLPTNQKHPVLLPTSAHFTKLLVDHYHKIYLHPGPSTLQALFQTKYWVPSLRRLVRQRTFYCLKCFKSKAKGSTPIMGDLPPCRLQGGRAFIQVGVDFAGPFMMKESLRRKAPLSKVYLCIFVCMASKAVHLEAVTSLTTEAFLATLSRFTSRRGFPIEIFSDCGLNFVGAANRLKEFIDWYRESTTQDAICDFCTKYDFKWNFNPPHSPNFGGLWEAGVKSSKVLLKKITGDSPLTFEEYSTLFSKIESILNSRPLCPLSSSPEETNYLSPGHFLIGRPLLAIPEPSLHDLPDNRLSRWQFVKKMSDQFWNRWRLEYLHTLQGRAKWHRKTPNLQVGDLVLLKSDAPSMSWPLAKVTSVHPGADGVIRVVTIETSTSSYRRSVSKLIPLLPLTSSPYESS